MLNKFLKIFFFLLVLCTSALANDDSAEYMDNGLPIHFKYMNGKTPVYIEFTDVIQDRYLVDVEWYPDWGLAPLLTGQANINFKLKDTDIKFTINADLFHIGTQFIKAENIESKEPIKVQFSSLTINPFDFRDVNFDGTDELVIRNSNGGQRGYDSYSVYLIQELEDSKDLNVRDG